MYENFFKFGQRPFAAAPRVDRYFPAKAIEAARQALCRSIERAEGAGLLIGPAGTGKTLLCQLLADRFRGQFAVALLSNGHLNTRRELLQAILFELGLPYRRLEEGELRLSLIDYLSSDQSAGQGMLLLLDEAHTFSLRLLEEVRLISNMVRHGQPRVRLVLAGGPALEERFASPRLEAFSQRIATRCYLESLDYAQTQQYVVAQLSAVGAEPQRIFTTAALEGIYRATDGVPRLINQVCDHALMLAFAGGRREIDAPGIDEAWSDLQQLPTPWTDAGETAEPAIAGHDDNFIEFGGLDDALASPLADARPAAVADSSDATLLLRQIDEHIQQIEQDFVPAQASASRQPIEAYRTSDPFGERFEEEEVLIDRYASLDLAALDRHAQVSSHEGRQLSAMLEPYLAASAAPRLSIVDDHDLDDRQELPLAAAPAAIGGWPSRPSHFEDESLNGTAPTYTAVAAAVVESSAENLFDSFTADTLQAAGVGNDLLGHFAESPAITSPPATARAEIKPAAELQGASDDGSLAGDEDLMIVEDDLRPEVHPFRRPEGAQVRRQEYRQLFSRLRRG